MTGAEQHANKQTNRLRDTETENILIENALKEKKKKTYLQTEAQANLMKERERQIDRERD